MNLLGRITNLAKICFGSHEREGGLGWSGMLLGMFRLCSPKEGGALGRAQPFQHWMSPAKRAGFGPQN